VTIDPDRDYLLSKVIDLNETLNEYRRELDSQIERNTRLIEQNASLVEANGQALATAQGWQNAHHDLLRQYDELTLALAVKWGDEKQTKFLRKLGHISD
jgi:hypothetical protein